MALFAKAMALLIKSHIKTQENILKTKLITYWKNKESELNGLIPESSRFKKFITKIKKKWTSTFEKAKAQAPIPKETITSVIMRYFPELNVAPKYIDFFKKHLNSTTLHNDLEKMIELVKDEKKFTAEIATPIVAYIIGEYDVTDNIEMMQSTFQNCKLLVLFLPGRKEIEELLEGISIEQPPRQIIEQIEKILGIINTKFNRVLEKTLTLEGDISGKIESELGRVQQARRALLQETNA